MNPLPRIVAMTLFIVLMALVALLAVPSWRAKSSPPPAAHLTPASSSSASAPNAALLLSHQLALPLALIGLGLSVTLIISMALRPTRLADSTVPFVTASRREFGALAKLAETSVAQGEELTRERDVRRRAEEDARLQQQLLTQSLDEKIRLGRDLHDGIIQSLYAVGLTLESVRALVKQQPEEADRQLEKTRSALNAAIRDVRAYIIGLAPENLRRAGFGHALSAMLNELGSGHEAQFDINIDDEAATLLTPEQSVEALQIAREAVSNALRHGGATRVTLRMHKSDRELCLLVQDNGRGFNASRSREGGHGLGNMRARTERLGATLRVTSQPGEGARVLATLPILESRVV